MGTPYLRMTRNSHYSTSARSRIAKKTPSKASKWMLGSGFYDVQHSDRLEPAGRAILSTNSDGKLQSKVIIPVSYPIPSGGPVGKLLTRLHRHYWRPAHMHFLFVKDGWYDLIT
jgi:hypothetical protein